MTSDVTLHLGKQARSQISQGGGHFWKLETTVIELDPNFHQS